VLMATQSSETSPSFSFEQSMLEISTSGVQQLTNISDMERILQETLMREKELTKQLKVHTGPKLTELETKLEKLEVLPTKLRPVFSQVRDLAETVDDTCVLAEKVSSKVKALDRTRHRLQQTQKRVEDIIEVQNCVAGIDNAMESQDWEKSCNLFKRYLSIVEQEKQASAEAHQRIQILEDASARQLQEKLEKLQNIIRSKAENASSEEEVIRFCQLFTPLGIADQGLKKYIQYVRSKLKDEADDLYRLLRRSIDGKIAEDKRISCTDAITSLFETVANYAQEQIPLVGQYFGEENVIVLLKELQQQCDVHAPKMLDRFQEQFSIGDTMKKIQTALKQTTRHGAENQARPAATELEEILDGMAALSQRAELYNRFMQNKASSIKQVGDKKPLTRLLHESMLDHSMHSLLDQYIIMEHYYMEESVKKAIQLNSQNVANILHSELVDHVFFVLRRCFNRSLYTYNSNAVCVMSNYINQCLSLQLKDELSNFQSSSQSEANTLKKFIGSVNSLFQSTENMKLLKAEAEKEVLRIFIRESNRQQVLIRLEEFVETSREFKALLDKNLSQLTSTVQPTLRSLMDRFRSCSYELNEYQFAENEINDPFVMGFIEELNEMFDKYRDQLVTENFESFVHLCLKVIGPQMEKTILQKQFTQFGALQLDKDLRMLISYFSTLSQRTIRGEFARLTQMASLLNLENVSEVLDYWGENSGQMTWRLAPSEVHRVLSRRMDFSGEEIAALKL